MGYTVVAQAVSQLKLLAERNKLKAERDRLAECLGRIARQKRSDELETDGDFIEGFDWCVDEARKALRDMEEK